MTSLAAAAPAVVEEVDSLDRWKVLLASRGGPGQLLVAFFWADFHVPSRRGGQMDQVMGVLAKKFPAVCFAKVEAEEVPDVTELYPVSSVPTFILLSGGSVVAAVEGANPPALAKAVAEQAKAAASSSGGGGAGGAGGAGGGEPLNERLTRLTRATHVMLFMKGNPSEPKCKFSRETVSIFLEDGVRFGSFNILADPEVRAGLKDFSDWKTFPQLYVDGKFIGGLDTIKQLRAEGKLLETVNPPVVKVAGAGGAGGAGAAGAGAAAPPAKEEDEEALNARLKTLTEQAPVVLFMKGSPQVPECGFSRKIVEILRSEDVDFKHFDILTDDAVRQGMKKYSDWPTFPQLYAKGQLVGGLDIVQEMVDEGGEDGEDGEGLADMLGVKSAAATKAELDAKLKALTTRGDIMLFMKGSPDAPQCGFSQKIVAILQEELGAGPGKFDTFDILTDDAVRQGMKTFSDWPTFPQLYVKGQFVGGLDIVMELKEEGDLEDTLNGE
eukprot:g4041.t1